MRHVLIVALIASAAAACRVDDTHYVFPDSGEGNHDAGIDAIIDGGAGLAIVVSPDMAAVIEGDESSVSVKLSEMPPGNVTVNVGNATGLSFNRATIDFSPTDWSASKLLVITAAQDDDAVSQQRTVILSATGLAEVPLSVQITDDDLLGIFAAPPSVNLTEGDVTTAQIRLTAQPQASTTVSLVSSMAGVASVSPPSLTFTTSPTGAGSWNTPQTITITAVQNTLLGNGSARIDASASGMGTTSIDVAITDDDSLGIDPSSPHLDIGEGMMITTFTVGLTVAPPGSLTVQVSSNDPAVTVSPPSLTFTTAAPQQVTVVAPQDANAVGEAAEILLHPTMGPATDRIVTVQVTDDDMQGIVVDTSVLTIPEGQARMVNVHLAAQPTGPVTVDLTPQGGAVSALPASLSFTTANWAGNQPVTISALQDPDTVTDSDTVRLSSTGLPIRNVGITIPDDDTQVIDASIAVGDQLAVTENGMATFTFNLRFQPTTSQTVTINAGANITRAPPSFTFTSIDYAMPRTVTVYGLENSNIGDLFSTVTLVGSGVGAADRVVDVRVVDNDNQDIRVSPANQLPIVEGGSSNVTVTLGANPSPATVTVMIASDDLSVAMPSVSSVVLTAANWQTGATLAVNAPPDGDVNDGVTTLHFTSPPLAERTLPVVVDDQDVLGIEVQESMTIAIAEGATGAAHVRLTRNPGPSGATVNVATAFGLTTQTPTVTFTTSNWNMYQAVDLKPERDDDQSRDSYNVTFTLALSTVSISRTVQENPDTTILIGYGNSGPSAGSRTITGLDGWGWAPVLGEGGNATSLPSCLEITKLFALPSNLPAGAQIHAGIYVGSGSGSMASPTGLVYDPGARDVSAGGVLLNDGPRCMPITGHAFVAASTTLGLTLLSTMTTSMPPPSHCQRAFIAGTLPNPFFFGASMNCSTDNMPARLWFIGYPSTTCTCNPPT